jgi:hypothetical protein
MKFYSNALAIYVIIVKLARGQREGSRGDLYWTSSRILLLYLFHSRRLLFYSHLGILI